MTTEPTKMHGGLIRRDKRVHTDKHGNTTTQHWNGRKDVHINARGVQVRAETKEVG